MGASILVALKPLLDQLEMAGAAPAFWWLIGGGVSYIVGAVFYSLRKPYMHATFHLFCLGGEHRTYHRNLADTVKRNQCKTTYIKNIPKSPQYKTSFIYSIISTPYSH